jgi:Polyketide cyclase / dehydrase and lipid transport
LAGHRRKYVVVYTVSDIWAAKLKLTSDSVRPPQTHRTFIEAGVDIEEPARVVWALIANLEAVTEWNPIVEFARLEGSKLVLELVTGETSIERIDTANMCLSYTVTHGRYAGAEHVGTLIVVTVGRGACRVIYTVRFSPQTCTDLLASTVRYALEGLTSRFALKRVAS